jgi:hypothetical protein
MPVASALGSLCLTSVGEMDDQSTIADHEPLIGRVQLPLANKLTYGPPAQGSHDTRP